MPAPFLQDVSAQSCFGSPAEKAEELEALGAFKFLNIPVREPKQAEFRNRQLKAERQKMPGVKVCVFGIFAE